jgi:hypothetical protein
MEDPVYLYIHLTFVAILLAYMRIAENCTVCLHVPAVGVIISSTVCALSCAKQSVRDNSFLLVLHVLEL